MLTVIRVRQLAIIDTLELELGGGLNVVTGETGAGKSILIGALKLVLGGRASADLVRSGADRAEVEAMFDLTESPELRERLSELLGHDEEELIVRRVVPASGRSRAYVNGTLATAVQLSQLTQGLVDICSQHEHHTLVDPGSHLRYLDTFADIVALRDHVSEAWATFLSAQREMDALHERASRRAEREATLRFQLDEIDAIDPKPGEREDIEREHERLAHAENLSKLTRHAEAVLHADDHAVCDHLARLTHDMSGLRGVDPQLDQLLDRLDAAHTDLEDLAGDLGRYARNVVFDPGRLGALDERMGALRRLERRYGGTLEAVLAHRAAARQELAAFDDLDDRLDICTVARDEARTVLVARAAALSESRHRASQGLADAITQELRDLGMGDARIEVAVDRLDSRGGLEIEGVRYSSTGMDRIEFLIAPNRGDPPRPLQRIASGGELSRALLAIKRVLSRDGPKGLYVFDEVDTGVGGAIAEVIGRKLADVARHHQVLCITHQPQIAVYGHRHFHVSKASDGDRTQSRVVQLEHTHRTHEVARMMGGLEITDATRHAAEELLQQAAAARDAS
jgi:DNA repair protein RecN (Recombination protein N)